MQLPSRRFFLTIIVSSLALTALLGIVAIVTSALGDIGSKVLGTTIAVDIAAVLTLCCAGKPKTQLHKTIQLIGILSSLAALLLAVYMIWSGASLFRGDSEGVLRALGVVGMLAVASAHACLILPSMGYNQTVRTIVMATLFCIAVVAELLINYFAISNFSPGDSYGKAIGVFLILDVLGTILIPLVCRFTPAQVAASDGVVAAAESPGIRPL